MNRKLEKLQAEFDEIKSAVAKIHDRAAAEQRDLSEDEEADVNTLLARAEEIKPQVEKEVADAKKLADIGAVFARANGVAAKPDTSDEVTPVDFLNRALGRPMSDTKLRALDVVNSATSAGLLPYTIQGGIIDFTNARRATVDSLQHFAVPAGATFMRRVLTGDATSIDKQNAESNEIASGNPTIAYVTVTPSTYAGGVRLTLQALNDTDPNAANVWLDHAVKQYAIKTNTAVCAALKTAATTTRNLANSGATAASIMEAIMLASDTVYSAYGEEADTIWVSADVKSWLATRVGSDGQFIFPMVNPNNRDGSASGTGVTNSGLSIGGLRVVVDTHFASSTFIVGCSKAGEVYESMYPKLEAWVVPTLEKEIAIAGELATYFRAEGFVKLVDSDGNASATPNFG